MARYIDAELFANRLLNAWDTADKEKKTEIVAILSDIVTPILVGTPTADVAPRKENDVPRYIKLPQPEYLPTTAEELVAFSAKLYQSPIEIIMQEMQTQFDGEVFKATQAYGINVDKDELIKALQYDRDQYDKGFADGSRIDTTAIRAEVAREIFEEIEKILDDSTIVSSSDWGRPYFNITNFRYGIFRLKTKYKEGQK